MRENADVPKSVVARTFKVARASLYTTTDRQATKDKLLLAEILEVLAEFPSWGHRLIALFIGRHRHPVLRVMKKYGLSARRKRKHRKKAADTGNPPSGIPNRIGRRCDAWLPNLIWVGDFTEWKWHGIRIFLATVMDQCTRQIVGWAIGRHHTANLVLQALEDAKKRRSGITPHIFHSDQGTEYRSEAVREWLFNNDVLPSHSAKASPGDNPHKESFFGRFKSGIDFNNCSTYEDCLVLIHHGIFTYNTRRPHTALKMTPQRFYEARMRLIRENGLQNPRKHPRNSV